MSKLHTRVIAMLAVAFAAASAGHVSVASAETAINTGKDEGITIDCRLGDGYAEPGTMITLDAAGDLPAVTYVCGDDGQWHRVATVIRVQTPIRVPVVALTPVKLP